MRNILILLVIALFVLIPTTAVVKHNSTSVQLISQNHHIDCMPIVPNHPYASYGSNLDPIENRNSSVSKWLAPSIKINVSGFSGSGTIIYYNEEDGYAYVQSCGHLWNRNMTATEGRQRKLTCSIDVWYHNDQKLSVKKNYPADVLYYSNTRGADISLLRFKPDWVPKYFPIADADYEIKSGTKLHSVGCDGGREVAHYDVTAVGYREINDSNFDDLVTKENSPRPGRSGGGLMSEDGYYVGICWGTSDKSGNGIGLFTPLHTIRKYNEQNGYGWLNDIGHLARKIPIEDRNNPQGEYPKNYIPLPGGNN